MDASTKIGTVEVGEKYSRLNALAESSSVVPTTPELVRYRPIPKGSTSPKSKFYLGIILEGWCSCIEYSLKYIRVLVKLKEADFTDDYAWLPISFRNACDSGKKITATIEPRM